MESVCGWLGSVQVLFNGAELVLITISCLFFVSAPPPSLLLGTLTHSSALSPALWDQS